MEWINRIHNGNTLEVLRQMPDELVDLVITSPPYWGLRDYGKDATTIWGGDKYCEHEWIKADTKKQEPHGKTSKTKQKGLGFEVDSFNCSKCNAWKGQFGLEPNLDMYVKNSVEIYNEIKRVLKDTGSFYLNIGDTFKDKQLLMIPYKVAIAMQEDGWILRSVIIWHKPNPMPTAVKDRLNNVYEPMFHFVKKPKYYYNLDAIREMPKTGLSRVDKVVKQKYAQKGLGINAIYGEGRETMKNNPKGKNPGDTITAKLEIERQKIKDFRKQQGSSKLIDRCPDGDLVNNPLGKNPGDFWSICTRPFAKAHFAVFPKELVERPIKSSCPPDGIVLDPFCGTGTACRVAKSFGRKYIGIDINSKYVKEFAKEEMGHGYVGEWI